jgi:diacylglycerol kinase (ATP)
VKPEPASHQLPEYPLPAVVVNPSNVGDVDKLQTQITRVCAEAGWKPPLWLQTTVEDLGAESVQWSAYGALIVEAAS